LPDKASHAVWTVPEDATAWPPGHPLSRVPPCITRLPADVCARPFVAAANPPEAAAAGHP